MEPLPKEKRNKASDIHSLYQRGIRGTLQTALFPFPSAQLPLSSLYLTNYSLTTKYQYQRKYVFTPIGINPVHFMNCCQVSLQRHPTVKSFQPLNLSKMSIANQLWQELKVACGGVCCVVFSYPDCFLLIAPRPSQLLIVRPQISYHI